MQVVGLRGGYHTALVMGGVNSKIHAKRLAQASEILIELRANGGSHKQLAVHCTTSVNDSGYRRREIPGWRQPQWW